MIAASKKNVKGVYFYTYDQLIELANDDVPKID